MTPDHRHIVEEVDREFPDLLRSNTIESCGRFTRICAARLHAADANWGLLSKRPGQTQYDGHAVDAIIYRSTEQVVDIIAGAHNPPQAGRPAWSLVPRDPSNGWAAPVAEPGSAGGEPPAPPAVDVRPLEEAIARLRDELAEARAETAALRQTVQALQDERAALRSLTESAAGEVERLKAAWNRPWHVRGSTSRDAYHVHQIDLVVSRDD